MVWCIFFEYSLSISVLYFCSTHFVLFVLETVVDVVVLFAPTAKIPSGKLEAK